MLEDLKIECKVIRSGYMQQVLLGEARMRVCSADEV